VRQGLVVADAGFAGVGSLTQRAKEKPDESHHGREAAGLSSGKWAVQGSNLRPWD